MSVSGGVFICPCGIRFDDVPKGLAHFMLCRGAGSVPMEPVELVSVSPLDCSAWRDMASAPKDDTEIIILFDSASVDIVRLCWWNAGVGCDFEDEPESRGWWSYQHSVTQELIDTDLMKPIGWMPHPSKPNKEGGSNG